MLGTNCPYVSLPPGTIEAILHAVNRRKPLTADDLSELDGWLAVEWAQALRRARIQPLTNTDVKDFNKAHQAFVDIIERLQDRALPPPRIPTNSEADWESWSEKYEQFGYIRGRRNNCDWLLIGALLALYEFVTEASSSGAQEDGPTMRYLETALKHLTPYAPAELRSYFQPPQKDALRKQLPSLKRLALRQATRTITHRLNATRE